MPRYISPRHNFTQNCKTGYKNIETVKFTSTLNNYLETVKFTSTLNNYNYANSHGVLELFTKSGRRVVLTRKIRAKQF